MTDRETERKRDGKRINQVVPVVNTIPIGYQQAYPPSVVKSCTMDVEVRSF